MKWHKEEVVRLKELYYQGIPVQEIAYKLNKSTGAIEGKLRFLAIKRNRSVPKLKLPTKITPPLARISIMETSVYILFYAHEVFNSYTLTDYR